MPPVALLKPFHDRDGVPAPPGRFFRPSACRRGLQRVGDGPIPFFCNARKG